MLSGLLVGPRGLTSTVSSMTVKSRKKGSVSFWPRVAATWDPANSAPGVVLTNGNKTASAGPTRWLTSRGTQARSTGKAYFEVTNNTTYTNNNHLFVGVVNPLGVLDGGGQSYPGWDGNGVSYLNLNGQIQTNGGTFATQDTWTTAGQICAVAVDLDTRTIRFGIVGIGLGPSYDLPSSMLTGDVYPAIGVFGSDGTNPSRGTLNFDATTIMPDGYSPWNGTG